MKKIVIHKEVLYIIALLLLSFGVALSVQANLGISTCSAPGLAISIKMQQVLNKDATNPFIYTVLTSLTFGEWVTQICMLLVFCIVIRRFRPIYLSSFVTAALYGVFLLAWQQIPALNPNLHFYFPMWERVIFLILAISIIALSVAVFFKNYFYPQVYNFQEKGYMEHFHWNRVSVVKIIFDALYGVIAFILIAIFFKSAKVWDYGLNWGTILSMIATGPLIGIFSKLINKTVETKTLLPKWEEAFKIENKKGY